MSAEIFLTLSWRIPLSVQQLLYVDLRQPSAASPMTSASQVCGSIAGYNGSPNPMYRHSLIFERDLTIYGFRVNKIFAPYRDSFYREMPKMIASGQIKYREHVTKGLENAGQALLDVQMGRNEGKSVIEVAKE